MKAAILSIGDEILSGDTLNTNANWIAKALTEQGFQVQNIESISDQEEDIYESLERNYKKNDLIIITGGLGPTNDDITKEVLARFFDCPLVTNNELKTKVENMYLEKGRSKSEVTPKMTDIPQCATMIVNNFGVAPALFFERDTTITLALPGVPVEMRGLMNEEILPRLKPLAPSGLVNKYVLTAGISEVEIAKRLNDIETSLPAYFSIAYLPSYSQVTIRLTGRNEKKEIKSLEQEATEWHTKIQDKLSDVSFSTDKDGSLVKAIIQEAKKQNATLCTAESCTGGNIAHQITMLPGVSPYYMGSCVTYSNESKINILYVKKESLQKHGAVSEKVVQEMVTGALQRFNTNYAVAVSGIAGPSGGTKEKPVGTVCIGVGNGKQNITKTFTFAKKREINIQRATFMALTLLYQFMKNQ